ncbi:MAG: uracil-DNA glycosylase [Gemmatimonadota bacterium]
MKDRLRRYIEGRLSLGEPEIIFSHLSRSEALARVRGCGAGREDAPNRAPTPRPAPPRPGDREIESLAANGRAEQLRQLPDLPTLGEVAALCTRCGLHGSRQHVVFGEGDPHARIVCVGEAPGVVEDDTGRPFVGRAGQLLDRLLLSVGLRRGEVYICNVLKCRPPGNRDPRPEEVEACSPFLLRQLELIDPEVIVAFGAFAARTLLGTRESLGRLRGRTHLYEGYPVVVTYHPAALLRNPWWTRPTWEDLQRVREVAARGREREVARSGPAQGGLFG